MTPEELKSELERRKLNLTDAQINQIKAAASKMLTTQRKDQITWQDHGEIFQGIVTSLFSNDVTQGNIAWENIAEILGGVTIKKTPKKPVVSRPSTPLNNYLNSVRKKLFTQEETLKEEENQKDPFDDLIERATTKVNFETPLSGVNRVREENNAKRLEEARKSHEMSATRSAQDHNSSPRRTNSAYAHTRYANTQADEVTTLARKLVKTYKELNDSLDKFSTKNELETLVKDHYDRLSALVEKFENLKESVKTLSNTKGLLRHVFERETQGNRKNDVAGYNSDTVPTEANITTMISNLNREEELNYTRRLETIITDVNARIKKAERLTELVFGINLEELTQLTGALNKIYDDAYSKLPDDIKSRITPRKNKDASGENVIAVIQILREYEIERRESELKKINDALPQNLRAQADEKLDVNQLVNSIESLPNNIAKEFGINASNITSIEELVATISQQQELKILEIEQRLKNQEEIESLKQENEILKNQQRENELRSSQEIAALTQQLREAISNAETKALHFERDLNKERAEKEAKDELTRKLQEDLLKLTQEKSELELQNSEYKSAEQIIREKVGNLAAEKGLDTTNEESTKEILEKIEASTKADNQQKTLDDQTLGEIARAIEVEKSLEKIKDKIFEMITQMALLEEQEKIQSKDINELKTQIQQINEANQNLTNQLASLNTKNSELDVRNQNLANQLSYSDKKNEELGQANLNLTNQLNTSKETHETVLNSAKKENEDLREENSNLKKEFEDYRKKSEEELQKQKQESEKTLRDQKEKFDRDVEKLNEELNSKKLKNEDLNKRNHELEGDLAKSQEGLSESQKREEGLRNETDNLKQKQTRSSSENKKNTLGTNSIIPTPSSSFRATNSSPAKQTDNKQL